MIQTRNLSYQYDQKNQFSFPDIHCESREHCLILGPSGKGKSTFLHLLSGLLRPKVGEVVIKDVDITKLSGSKLDNFRGQEIGLIFQKSHFLQALTVEENLLLAQKLSGEPRDLDRIHQLLDRLNMSHKTNAKPGRLSQGEQQRVAIARALVNRPTVILADEPTSALDDENCVKVLDLLMEQSDQENASLIVVTHDNRLKHKISKQYQLV